MSAIPKELPKAKGKIEADRGLAEFTRFRVGGPAEILFSPLDTDDLAHFLRHAPKDMNVHALGFGSNVLIRDGGIKGIVVRLGAEHFSKIDARVEAFEIRCGAFASNISVAKAAAEAGIAGFEFLYGIPGSIGGAIITNAGCFGGEVKDILTEIETINVQSGETKKIAGAECGLGYRHSGVPDSQIITRAILRGRVGEREKILARMEEIQEKKDKSQPTHAKTAGSVFKNPEGHAAWKLIKDAGCQGMKEGCAAISEAHANFIVNEGGASAADIEDLAEKARFAVHEKFGITLEYEIKILGSRI